MKPSDDRRPGRAAAAPFSFDVASGTLWQGSRHLPVRARTAAVLRHLLERRGDVVSPDELRRVVWGRRHGSENGPKQCVRELRSLLSDDAAAPRYIETVGRSGYRLIGGVELIAGTGHASNDAIPAALPPAKPLCVGREREMQELEAALAAAGRGERPVLFVAGEPGIGKTTLIDAFAVRFEGRRDLWLGRGQCVPHDGPGEAYGPLLTAAEQLAGGPARTLFVDIVRRLAPRLPALLPAVFDRREALEKQVEATGSGPEQTPRQLTHVFEELSRILPGVIVIEDAHWADGSTCNWISAWALRQAPANLLLVVSYRPGGTADHDHPARRMLAEVCRALGFRTLELSGLTTKALARYLDLRFPENAFSTDLATVLQKRTEGHALFAAGIIDDWLAQGVLSRRTGRWGLANRAADLSDTVPSTVHAMIDRQLSQLADSERRLLECASAAGLEFSAAVLADSSDDIDAAELQCEALVRRQLLVRRSDPVRWPDGTEATGYGFRHALYRHAIDEAMPLNLKRKLHRRIGLRLEKGHGRHASDIAAVLGDHFALGGDDRRAALYARKAGEAALLRGAAREAQTWLRRALTHIARWPPGRARDSEEIRTQTNLGAAHNLVDGFASPPAAAAFERAYVLSRRAPDSKSLMPILTGLFNYRIMTNDAKAAKRLAARIHRLAQGRCAPGYALDGYNTVGYMHWRTGRYAAALSCIEKVAAAYRVRRHGALSTVFGEDPGIACRYCGSVVCIMMGDVDAARRHLAAGTAIAHAIRQPFAVAQMLWSHCAVAHECGDAGLLQSRALELLSVCEKGGIDYWRRPGRAFAGWAAAAMGDEGGLARMAEVLQEWRDIAMFENMHYMLALYAEACMKHDRPAAAGDALAEALALVRRTGECWFEAELHRLRGELALRSAASATSASPAASACFRQAARLARRQGAGLLELRALLSLARLRAACGEHADVIRTLAPARPLIERANGLPIADEAEQLLARASPDVEGKERHRGACLTKA